MPRGTKEAPPPKLELPPELAIHGVDLKDKHVVLRDGYHKKPVVRKVALCTGGFGCSPTALGSAVFAKLLYKMDSDRYDRGDVERLATEDEVKEAEKFYKDHGFIPTRQRAERGKQFLLLRDTQTKRGDQYFRSWTTLVRHKRTKEYELIVYMMDDEERWSVVKTIPGNGAPDPDKLLKKLLKDTI